MHGTVHAGISAGMQREGRAGEARHCCRATVPWQLFQQGDCSMIAARGDSHLRAWAQISGTSSVFQVWWMMRGTTSVEFIGAGSSTSPNLQEEQKEINTDIAAYDHQRGLDARRPLNQAEPAGEEMQKSRTPGNNITQRTFAVSATLDAVLPEA